MKDMERRSYGIRERRHHYSKRNGCVKGLAERNEVYGKLLRSMADHFKNAKELSAWKN